MSTSENRKASTPRVESTHGESAGPAQGVAQPELVLPAGGVEATANKEIALRKEALTAVNAKLQLMPNEDVERVLKLAKATLKSRTTLDLVTAELDVQ